MEPVDRHRRPPRPAADGEPPPSLSSEIRRYGPIAPLLTLAWLVRAALGPLWGDGVPFVTLYPAVMLCAWLGGRGPGLAATALGAGLATLVAPVASGDPAVDAGRVAALAIFVASGIGTSWLAGSFHRTRSEAEAHSAALEELAERLDVAQDAAGAGFWEWRVEEGTWRWTDATARLFGQPPGSPPRRELWRSRVEPADRPRFDDLWRAIAGDQPPAGFDLRYRVRLPGERVAWRRSRGRVIRDESGRAVRVLGITLDVTGEVEDELALRESEARLQAVLDSTSALVYVKDRAGRLLLANRRFAEVVGMPLDRILGFTEADFLADEAAAQALRENDREVLERGEPAQFEETLTIADGRIRTYVSVKVPLRGPDGGIDAVCGVSTDITELRASERLYRGIGESMNYGVWVTDAAGRNVYASESLLRLTGLTQEECSGAGWVRALHPDEAEATAAAWARCVAQGRFWEREQRFRGVDGEWHHVLTRGMPIRGERGEITGWAGFNLDIGALKRAQEALEESDRRKDEFLAMLSHELRNPLNAVVGATNLLDRGGAQDEMAARARDVIVRQTKQLARLLDDLLDVTRVTSGKILLRREPVRLDRMVEECVATLRTEGRAAGHRLEVEAADPLWSQVDRARIEQVVSNLLGNAVKYTPRGGTIRISVRRAGDHVEIAVEDDGAGIPADLLPRVFELFVQGDGTADRSQGGLGIGLTLAQRIVELHDGSITAESEGPGRGSRFTVRLPAAMPAPAASPEPRAAPGGRRLRILVVEDHEDSRTTLRQLLELDGHEVRVAADGPDGLALALEWRPQVALVDLGLPGLDGLALARGVRERLASEIRLVALTGYGRPDDVERARAAGFEAHLTKPFELDALARVLAATPENRGTADPAVGITSPR